MMSVAICLLIASLVVATFGPPILTRATRSGAAPRWGVAAWAAAIGGVASAWLAVAVMVVVGVLGARGSGSHFAEWCLALLQDMARGAPVPVLVALAVLALPAVGLPLWRVASTIGAGRIRGRRHSDAARIVGRRTRDRNVVILDVTERAAYCLPGRPHTIVVTSTAVEALTDRQLAAVLAHERAHLAGHHHLLVALSRGLARAFPRVRLFAAGARQIARLVELCADDAAARRTGPRPVAEALLALTSAGPGGALAAGGMDALARAHRLLTAESTARWRSAHLLLIATTMVLVAGPFATAALAAAGTNFCLLPTV